MDNSYIARVIKQLCNEKKITISSLLEECDLTKSFIYDLEKRKTSPSCEKISRIADYLNCTVDYLLGKSRVLQPQQEFFSQEEIELIHAYRCAKPDDKTIVNVALHKYMQPEAGKTVSAG